jgi:hypothetical protein
MTKTASHKKPPLQPKFRSGLVHWGQFSIVIDRNGKCWHMNLQKGIIRPVKVLTR